MVRAVDHRTATVRGWRLRLPADDARRVLLLHAVEDTDRDGVLLAPADARDATRRARAGAADAGRGTPNEDAAWLALRARGLIPALEASAPRLARARAGAFAGRNLLLAAVPAFVIGLATNALGSDQRVHVLAVPLLALLIWNVATMMLGLVRHMVPLPGGVTTWIATLRRWFERGLDPSRGVVEPTRTTAAETPSSHASLAGAAAERFLATWARAAAPLIGARLRRALHGASIALIAGVVVGMYIRGLGLAYEATWESTFLGVDTVQRLMDVVLGPAALLLGVEVPAVAPIRAPASGNAAPWIHLWAMTAVWLVIVPRLVLFGVASWRAARHHRALRIELPAAYRRRLLVAAGDVAHRFEVVPYSHRPAAGTTAALEAAVAALAGPEARLRVHPTIDYGEETVPTLDAGPTTGEAGARVVVVLFPLAQTPEVEVHGAWLADLRQQVGDVDAWLVVVDGEPYRARLGLDDGSSRLASRRTAWDRTLREAAGVEPLHVLLRLPLADDTVERWIDAARPNDALTMLNPES